MNPSQRIVLNTIATYTRSVLSAGFALFSSRWVLNALGQTDFGLFSVVGSLIIFTTFLNSSMASSSVRFFAYAIGQGDTQEVNRWFNAALGVHFLLATSLVFIGWFVGGYVICNILTIPPERVNTCVLVFRISLGTAFISMVSTPFIAMFAAKQHIVERAIWDTLYSLLTFFLAWILSFQLGNRLIFYAIGMSTVLFFIQIIQMLRASTIFDECKISFIKSFDEYCIKKISSFACLNLISPLGALLSNQGSAVLLNIFFGPKLNSAYGIANNIAGQANQLATSMIGAFSPEMTACEGGGDRMRMLSLADQVNKFGTILVMLFALPLIVEIDYVLKLWLIEPPPYTDLFCTLILVAMIIDRLSTGYMIAVYAHGNISGFQITLGAIKILTLPLGWLFLKYGFSPTSLGVALIIMQVFCTFGRVVWCRRLFGLSIIRWLTHLVIPCTVVAVTGILGAYAPHLFQSASFARLFISSILSLAAALLAAWFFALNGRERIFAKQNIKRLINKISTL